MFVKSSCTPPNKFAPAVLTPNQTSYGKAQLIRKDKDLKQPAQTSNVSFVIEDDRKLESQRVGLEGDTMQVPNIQTGTMSD